jgi:release factor glutamine methyltransferase
MPSLLQIKVGGRVLALREEEGVHPVDRVARLALRKLGVREGEDVLDLGCGTGIYGLAAAALGARKVVLADIDPRAARLAEDNARRNGIRTAEVRVGDFFGPVGKTRFDWILASLPQTPGPRPFLLSKWGGPDGTRHLRRLLDEAPAHLKPGGRLFLLLHDLGDSSRVRRTLARRFSARTVLRVRRPFSRGEYDGYLPGLFGYLERQKRRGKCIFHGRDGRYWFWLRFIVATLKGPRRRVGKTRSPSRSPAPASGAPGRTAVRSSRS